MTTLPAVGVSWPAGNSRDPRGGGWLDDHIALSCGEPNQSGHPKRVSHCWLERGTVVGHLTSGRTAVAHMSWQRAYRRARAPITA